MRKERKTTIINRYKLDKNEIEKIIKMGDGEEIIQVDFDKGHSSYSSGSPFRFEIITEKIIDD